MSKDVVKWVLAVCAIGLLAGCATPTVESRKKERYAAYAALSPDMREAVDRGTVKVGMPMDAVYIAWGNPDQVTQSGNASGETTTWMYYGGYMAQSSYWGWQRLHYVYTPVNYVRAEVVFANGSVREWRTFPQPPY